MAEGSPEAALTPEALARAYGVEARVSKGEGGMIIDVIGRAG
jgi:actin-like ATPase involved in cell morphogenesis